MTTKPSNLLPFSIAFLLATLVGLLLMHPEFFVQSDVLAIWTANQLFRTGGNPYSQQEMLAAQLAINAKLATTVPIWNPPLLFLTVGWLASLSPQEAVIALTVLRALCATLLAAVGFALAGLQAPPTIIVCLIVACTPAYLAEAAIGQYSSFVCASFATGYLLFTRRVDFLAGFFLVATLLKPHDVLLPAIVLVFRAITERRWQLFLGALTAIITSTVALELLHPGIHTLWLYREVWPLHVFGSTLSSVVRSGIFSTFGYVPWWPLVGFPCIGILCLCVAKKQLGFSYGDHSTMMLAFSLNVIFSPYGFIFDQCILLVPLAYYYAHVLRVFAPLAERAVIVFFATVWCALYAFLNSLIFECRSYWFVFSSCATLSIFTAEVWLEKKRAFRKCP